MCVCACLCMYPIEPSPNPSSASECPRHTCLCYGSQENCGRGKNVLANYIPIQDFSWAAVTTLIDGGPTSAAIGFFHGSQQLWSQVARLDLKIATLTICDQHCSGSNESLNLDFWAHGWIASQRQERSIHIKESTSSLRQPES